jgi:hypothetical protein
MIKCYGVEINKSYEGWAIPKAIEQWNGLDSKSIAARHDGVPYPIGLALCHGHAE